MNEELFNIYLDEVFIPGVDNLRKIKNIPTAWAGLAMDQFSGHNSDRIRHKLEANKIKVVWLPPHTSHLTQPLDLVTFGIFKSSKSNRGFEYIENKQARRLMRDLEALDKATAWTTNTNAFWKAGWHVDRDSNPFNLCHHIAKVLEHPRAHESAHKRRAAEEKKEATAKRRKLKFGMSAAQLKALNKKLAKVPTTAPS